MIWNKKYLLIFNIKYMGFFRNIPIKWTTNTIHKTYIKIRGAYPDLSEMEVLQRIIELRGPFWRLDSEGNTIFKGYSAFVINDKLQIGRFIMLINIWESIIATPKNICSQSTSMPELRELIVNIETITLNIFLPSSESAETILDGTTEKYLTYCLDVINKLGGKIL